MADDRFAALPPGPFSVVVADPPWMYQKRPGLKTGSVGTRNAAEVMYPTLTNEEIGGLPVRDVVASDAHLFLWFTNPGMFGGRFSTMTPAQIAEAWGFTYRTTLTWVKTTAAGGVHGGGMGWYFRGATEHVLYATRGKAAIPSALRRPNVFLAPKSRHSQKPDAFHELVESVTDGPRLELFARTCRPGWTCWGNELEAIA